MIRTFLCSVMVLTAVVSQSQAQDAKPKPLKALLVTGGCCHEYAKQKDILKKGLEARIMVELSHVHTDDTTTKARFDLYDNPEWFKGYDIILHDECTSDVIEEKYVFNILNAHKAGLPAVNLHCAMHSYRLKGMDDWFQFVGIQSNAHDAQKPIEITFIEKGNPITKTLENWTTVNEELYNNLKLFPTAKPLARGRQDLGKRVDDYVVVWTNQYGKGKVFSTTLGHNTETVADARYLDLVARGVLWACDKLKPEYLQPNVAQIDLPAANVAQTAKGPTLLHGFEAAEK